jgi:cystathionine beta-lyase
MAGIVPHVGVMGYGAALTAYRDSAEWHAELIEYLRKNRDIVERTIRDIPGLSMPHVEATYLAWIDTHSSGLKDPVKFFEDAGVGLWDSRDFGGSNAVRLNFACQRALLDKALDRMAEAMARLP